MLDRDELNAPYKTRLRRPGHLALRTWTLRNFISTSRYTTLYIGSHSIYPSPGVLCGKCDAASASPVIGRRRPVAFGNPAASSGMSTFENMSWFSFLKFPPPHDAKARSQEKKILEEPSLEASPDLQPQLQRNSRPSQEVDRNRNKVIFGAGVAFFAFSLLITRRSFARKRLQAHPAFYTDAPANVARQAAKTSGAMEALEALNIATINVLSVTMMATGGALWYMDINSMADARRMLRGGLGVDGTGRDETQAEEEFEEWMATVLSRRDAKEKSKDDTSAMKRVNERGQER
jgi:hypothetical protein